MDESPPVERDTIVEALERVLSSATFRRAERSSGLLRYLTEQVLAGQADRLKEYTLGAEALGRGTSFDPRTDPIVRAEASRLRARLEHYYEIEGRTDDLIIELPKGSYVLQFSRGVRQGRTQAEKADGHPSRPFSLNTAGWFAILGVFVAGVVAVAWWIRSPTTPSGKTSVLQFEVELKSDGVLGSEVGTDVVLSADGTRLVFVSHDSSDLAHLYTRRLDQPNSSLLPGTEGARGPFISPDGEWVGFWADGKLKKTSVDGGSPVVLCAATDLLGASWGEDGSIIAALNPTQKLWRVPVTGGRPEAVLDLSGESASPMWPQILPGGHLVMYTVNTGAGADSGTIEVLSIPTGERKVLLRGGTYGRYLSNGYLTYVNQGTLYALRFDANRRTVSGASIPLIDDVSYSRTFGYAQMDVSQTGTLVYRRGAESGRSIVEWLDRLGRTSSLLATPGRYNWLRLSPDSRRLALVATESGTTNIWIHNTQGDETRRLSTASANYSGLMWWPSSNRLVFSGLTGMTWIDAEHPEQLRSLMMSRSIQVPWSVAPDGRRLAYYEMNPETGFDLWTVPITTTEKGFEPGTPEPFLRTPAFEVYPSFSPDGRWIIYASNESGTYEVYVRRFPDDGMKVRVSNGGGSVPRWSPNGRELVYRTDNEQIMVTSYKVEGNSFVVGVPHAWAAQSLADTGVLPNFDVASDGERIVALMPAMRSNDQQSQNHVTIMLNFLEEVRQREAVR